MNTPGIYIQEKSSLGNSVSGISTAVPVFIGFTQKEVSEPQQISSMLAFTTLFGAGYEPTFEVSLAGQDHDHVTQVVPSFRFFLFDALRLYFNNGGGPCYVISAGTYNDVTVPNPGPTPVERLTDALDKLDLDTVAATTLVSIPDLHAQKQEIANGATVLNPLIPAPNFTTLVGTAMGKCEELKKILLLDSHEASQNPLPDAATMRDQITPTSATSLNQGVAYYPWVLLATPPVIGFDRLSLKDSEGDPYEDNDSEVLADLNQVSDDLDDLETKFGMLPTLDKLRSAYQGVRDYSNKTKFTGIFSFLYGLVRKLDTSSGITSLEAEITALQGQAQFRTQLRNLFRFKGILDNEDNPNDSNTPTSDYLSNIPLLNNIDSSWYDDANNPSTVSELEEDADLLVSFTEKFNREYIPIGNNSEAKPKRGNILADLESGQHVDLDVILGGIAGLTTALLHKKQNLEARLFSEHPVYQRARAATARYMQQIPVQTAVVGIYCENDRKRGVWRSPANMAIRGIAGPLLTVTHAEQDTLNVDAGTGKSINVIRNFTGKGTLLWGARTLAGNDNEWRYVAVRRFFNYVEKSVQKALQAFLFETNNARTWVKVRAMITSFLVEQWRQGALLGSSYEEAFFVKVGKPETISTAEEKAGIMNVEIGLAVVRPAEFIVVRFAHQLEGQ